MYYRVSMTSSKSSTSSVVDNMSVGSEHKVVNMCSWSIIGDCNKSPTRAFPLRIYHIYVREKVALSAGLCSVQRSSSEVELLQKVRWSIIGNLRYKGLFCS